VTELDGAWAVDRVSGALPPLHGCVKRINGDRGTTEFPHLPGMPFEVRGLELHYRPPFAMLVDRLEPQNGGYLGHATMLGREFGRFRLRRLTTMDQLKAQHTAPSTVKQFGGVLGALAKLPLDFVRGEKAGRNARDAYATEHLEIASYELLRRIAQKAGDEKTAEVVQEIIAEEQAMAKIIEDHWDTFAELSLREEGITV
jgi:hypothetical protein